MADSSSRAGMIPELFRGDGPEWDRFVSQQRGFTHGHQYGWKDLIEEVFGHETLYYITRDNRSITAALPLVRVRSRLFGHYLVSMPFLNYGGPLGEPEGAAAVVGAAIEEAERSGVGLLELRSVLPGELDLTVSHRKITVVLELSPDSDAVFGGFPAKLRSQIRRPIKEGIEVRFGPDQVDPFFEVFSRHMRDLGTPTLPRRFFHAVANRFPETAWFGCAWMGRAPVAGGAGFRADPEFEMTWASSLGAYNRVAPNMLLYWSFMERAVREGLTRFNFGRCTPGSGTHRFKRQWGSQDQPLFWYQWTPAGTAAAATPSPDQDRYRWGPRLWKHLPLGISRWLGPRIVRFIP